MKFRVLTLYTFLILSILFIAHFNPNDANALVCTYSLDGDPPNLGCYLKDQVIPAIWVVFRTILVAIVFIFTVTLIYRTATNRDNPDAIAQIKMQWIYLIILILLTAGAGGAFLGFGFNLFGFGDLDGWLKSVNGALDAWDNSVQ